MAVTVVAAKRAGIHFVVVGNGFLRVEEVVAYSRDAVTFGGWDLLQVVAPGVGSGVRKRWGCGDPYSFGAF